MDTALQNALKRRTVLLQEIEKIDRFVAAYQEFSGTPVKVSLPVVSAAPLFDAPGVPEKVAESAVKPKRHENPKLDVIVRNAIEIMRDTGRPMSRREVHTALAARGLEVKGAEPTKTLGTMLWRARDHIDSIDGRGYWPKGDPVPPVSMDEPHAALLAGRRHMGKTARKLVD